MSAQLPPRLYKYQPFTALTLANLKNRLWYFAPPAVFNDPFDCRYALRGRKPSRSEMDWLREEAERDASVGNHELKSKLEKNPDALFELLDNSFDSMTKGLFQSLENRGVCCFSERVDSLLMWSHYADGHRGFCLEFDTSSEHFSKFRRVEYHGESPRISIARVLNGDAAGVFEAIMCAKPRDWAYEEEWRAFHETAGKEYCYGTDPLTAIYFGSQMPFVHRELLALVLRGSRTKLIQAKLESGSYTLSFEHLQYSPHPEAGGGSPNKSLEQTSLDSR